MSRSSYPYVNRQQSCKFKKSEVVAKVSGVSKVSDPKVALASGPITAYIQTSNAFDNYGGGIFNGNCGKNYDHDVAIVGWGVSGSREYWILRNSYGSNWGESGYMKVQIGGKCKLQLESFPIIA